MLDYKLIEEKLGASIISDVLDGMGIRGQSMYTTIRPIADDMTVAGIAATMLMSDQFDYEKDTFAVQFKAIDALKPGEKIEAVIEKVLDVTDRESKTRDELKNGIGLYDVYKKYETV
jgi:regulator of RNase E activity RraA